MSEERALLRAIVDAPDDDTVRLVYADWLQEHGRSERAEFIRIECEQAGLLLDSELAPNRWDCPRFWELEDRRRELYDRHAAEWFAPLQKVHRGEFSTHRGFPHQIALTARKFIDRGAELFRAAPTIDDVYLERLVRNTAALARCAALDHVRKLTFFETPFYAREAREFFRSPHLGGLRELHIGFADTQIGYAGAVALAGAKSLRQLQKLDISNHGIGDHGAEAILDSECLDTLTDVHLGNNGLTDTATAALSWADGLKLTSLDLMQNHLSGPGLVALHADHFAGLEFLSVMQNPIGCAGAANLAAGPFAAGLRELRASNCEMDDLALAVLLAAAWPKLTKLSLWMNQFGVRAAAALHLNRSLAGLEELSVARSDIGPAAARALGRVSLPALRKLNLDYNPLGPKGLRALLAGPLVRPVRDLSIASTDLGDDGAAALAKSPAAANVRTLWLQKNRLTNRGALALAESPHLAEVQSLYMPDNKVGKKGRAALTRRFGARVSLGT